MQFLRRNTAVIVAVGPFLDKTDGVTLKTALTITNEKITLTADTDDGSAPTNILDNVTGATSGTSNDLNYITGNDAAMMQLELSAANTDRLGRMTLIITDAANHVPVFQELFVLPAAIYDFLAGTAGFTAAMFALDTGLRPVRSGTAQAGAASTITLDAGASAIDDFYNYLLVQITSGAGAGQIRVIADYVGATKVATVATAWSTNPDNTSVFNLLTSAVLAASTPPSVAAIVNGVYDEPRSLHSTVGTYGGDGQRVAVGGIPVGAFVTGAIQRAAFAVDTGLQPIRSATAQAAAAGTITFDVGASSIDNFYQYQLVLITGGTGVGQARMVTSYVGGTKVATVSQNWGTTPDGTSTFSILPSGIIDATIPVTVKKNTAFSGFQFLMFDSLTKAPAPGRVVTALRSIDGVIGAGSLSPVTEVGSGAYKVDFANSDLNGNCILMIATAPGCDVTFERFITAQ